MTKSKIQWTNDTWNPIVGCSLVSPGCTNCYAMKAAHRMGHNPKTPQYQGLTEVVKGNPVWIGQVNLHEPALRKPLSWSKPRRIFVNSMGDLFHEDVPDEWIDRVFAVMALCPQHSFQVLTKRAERMRDYMTKVTLERIAKSVPAPSNLPVSKHRATAAITGLPEAAAKLYGYARPTWPLPNVWLGVSTEDQTRANDRIPFLLETPAAVRFVSAEPLLGPIDFTSIDFDGESEGNVLKPATLRELWEDHFEGTGDEAFEEYCDWYNLDYQSPEAIPDTPGTNKIDWIIAGGESGPNARPMHPDWVRGIRDQCIEAGTAFFFKQWGEWLPWEPEHGPCWISQSGCSEDGHILFPADIDSDASWDDGLSFIGEANQAAFQKVGKDAAGADLDGGPWEQYPTNTAPNSENRR